MRGVVPSLVALLVAFGCGGDPDPIEILLPIGYETSFVEVRDCRRSADHNLTSVRILADPATAEAYMLRDRPFPVGSVIVKEERDYADDECSGPIESWTIMRKLPEGAAPETLDWEWQQLGPTRQDQTEDVLRCASCHEDCGMPPDGYLGTCAVP